MPRVAILFDNFGPYHLARLRAASSVCEVLAVEFGSSSAEYDWTQQSTTGFKRVVINHAGSSNQLGTYDFREYLFNELKRFKPDVVFVPGWSTRGAILAIKWCIKMGVPSVVMSESTEWDSSRNALKELVKRSIVSAFSAAMVGGTSHRSYIHKLGMPSDRIFIGYDVVDNRFFREESRKLQACSWELGKENMRPYFLASARFIEKKNLPRLLKAYASYRGAVMRSTIDHRPSTPKVPWDLVLLGDGHLRPELERLRRELGLEDCVQMPGFKQYEALPGYYAHAGAFIHASTTEQWGLVVNEAMASGLPVLVSNRCGCAADLVKEGINGYTFDPFNEMQLCELMEKVAFSEDEMKKMGAASIEIISSYDDSSFGRGILASAHAAIADPKPSKRRLLLLFRLINNYLKNEVVISRHEFDEKADFMAVFHYMGRKILALPYMNDGLYLTGIKSYKAHTLRRQFYITAMLLISRFNAGRLISEKVSVSNISTLGIDCRSWVNLFEEKLHISGLKAVINWPARLSRKRTYLHLYDRNNREVAFVKIASDREDAELLKKEISALQNINVESGSQLSLLRCLDAGHFMNASYLAITPLPDEAFSLKWNKDHDVAWLVDLYGGPKKKVSLHETEALSWWRSYLESLPIGGLDFHKELLDLINEGIDVRRVHGDLSLSNLVYIGNKPCLFDWECSHEQGPILADAVGYYLSFTVGEKYSKKASLDAFSKKFLSSGCQFRMVDVMLALAYRHSVAIPNAEFYIRNWRNL